MKILITSKAYIKLKYYVTLTENEISGLGTIEKKDNQTLLITNIYLFKQNSGYVSTDLDKKEVCKFVEDEFKKGHNVNLIKVWWHSHANMNCFWSGTDINCIEDFGQSSNFLISLVVNHKLEMLSRIDIFDPIRATLDNLQVTIDLENEKIKEKIQQEIKEKVKKPFYNNWKQLGFNKKQEKNKFEKKHKGKYFSY